MTQIATVEEFREVSLQVGGLVPVSFAAYLGGACDKSLRERIERGTLRAWAIGGGVFVSVLESQKRSPGRRKTLPTGEVFFRRGMGSLRKRLD
jgi:hypothetical protein